jgi:hypothetical protein
MSTSSVFGLSTSFLAFESRVQQLTSVLALFEPQSAFSATTAQQSLFFAAGGGQGGTGSSGAQSSSLTPGQQALNGQVGQEATSQLTQLQTQNTNEINTLTLNQPAANPNANIITFLNGQNTLINNQLNQNTQNADNPFNLLTSTTNTLLQQYSLNLQEINTLNNGLDPLLPSGNAAAVNVLSQQNLTIINAISANQTALFQLPAFITPPPAPPPPSQAVPFYFLPPNGSVLNLVA